MKLAPFAVFFATLAVALGAGCSQKNRVFGSGGSGGGSGSSSSGAMSGSSSSGVGGSGATGGQGLGGMSSSTGGAATGGQGMGGGPPPPAPCNPVTSVECDSTIGDACDWNGNGFQCFPGPNNSALCQPCGPNNNNDFCQPGMTCLDNVTCAAYCCSDADCSTGHFCDTSTFGGFPIGVCVYVDPDGGARTPDCNVALPVPSQGTCYTPP